MQIALDIQEVKLERLGGNDSNDNGKPDWMELSISQMTGIDTVQSYISPACIEG